MDTLLVIDMQNAWLNGDTPRLHRAAVITRINHAAQQIRAGGGKVIFIRHCDAECVPGTALWQVDSDLRVADADTFVDKTACDAFADTSLRAQLQATGTQTLFICGLATEFCVDTSLRAAVSQGFDVVALSDAHTTGDRLHLSAERIVEHHNWVWANMAVPHGRTLKVQTVQETFAAPA
ncbi:MAG: isochorismatase family protein [Pseudomonadota bacterium]